MHASDDRVDDGRKETKQRNVNGREPCMVDRSTYSSYGEDRVVRRRRSSTRRNAAEEKLGSVATNNAGIETSRRPPHGAASRSAHVLCTQRKKASSSAPIGFASPGIYGGPQQQQQDCLPRTPSVHRLLGPSAHSVHSALLPPCRARRASDPHPPPCRSLRPSICKAAAHRNEVGHNADSIIKSKVIYYLEQCGLRV